jgi:hypothetical protein
MFEFVNATYLLLISHIFGHFFVTMRFFWGEFGNYWFYFEEKLCNFEKLGNCLENVGKWKKP